ncbi:DNA polymerase subunit gamma-2, mitochondrial [Anopheles marshallii]|uniref:DNA polymerase subunit gamma-2, mitochondrial n=1 Tax=Anopheles marshallii TaxID=1521116 RepID=UPI00237BC0B8|nr:DNA polymerase subunit gamma-2, mitochondrial [Anopheles marshallii]
MARSSKTMLDLLNACRRSKFLDFSLDNTTIRGFRLTSIGQQLSGHMYTEWNQPAASNSYSVPVFFGKSGLSLKENIAFVQRENKIMKRPFGITVEHDRNNNLVTIGDDFKLDLPETLELATTYLLPTSMANQFLYQMQRQRKIWWMRLSVDPGRYFISDMRQTEGTNPTTSVSICGRFLDRSEHKTEVELERLDLEFSENSNAIVRVSNNLHRAILAILMDALEGAPLEQCVKIHRKIAPFKCGIICQMEDPYVQDAVEQQELIDLSKHLSYVLRAAKLSVHDGSYNQSQYVLQLAELDQIGVPYALLLNAQTLHTGLLQLRSRDTTLSETIHLSDLPGYLLKIINA